MLRDRIQHRLNISWRASDDAQNLTRRRLLFQRFLEFLEQPHVLNGDHGLVGKGFKELDLGRSEGTNLGSTCVQRSNEFSLLTKGNGQPGAPTGYHCRKIILRGSDVGNMKRAMLAYPVILWLIHTDLGAINRPRTKMSSRHHCVSFMESH